MSSVVEQIRDLFQKRGISTRNVGLVTLQRSRGQEFCSAVVDFENDRVMDVYPLRKLPGDYQEFSVGDVLVCYKEDLPVVELEEGKVPDSFSFPCCDGMSGYRIRRLDKDMYFTQFYAQRGSIPGIIFEVKRQVDNGPILDTTYFELSDGERVVHPGPFSRKLHAFKNYKCTKCHLFFSVDLYTKTGGYNSHHMRLNPFTKNIEQLGSFLADM